MGTNNTLLATIIISQVMIISACSICSAENQSADESENTSLAQVIQSAQQQEANESKSLEATTAHEVIIFEPMYITASPTVQEN